MLSAGDGWFAAPAREAGRCNVTTESSSRSRHGKCMQEGDERTSQQQGRKLQGRHYLLQSKLEANKPSFFRTAVEGEESFY